MLTVKWFVALSIILQSAQSLDYLVVTMKKICYNFRYLEENKLSAPCLRVQEENWDGCSMTFQGSNAQPVNYRQLANYHQPSGYNTLPSGYSGQPMPQAHMYHSLPRGRGRLLQEYEPVVGGTGGSVTPDRMFRSPCSSRPPTPPPFSHANKSTENLNQFSRSETPIQSHRLDENYNARRNVERQNEKKTPYEFRKPYNDDKSNAYHKSSDETLASVAKALAEDNGNKTPTKGSFRQSLEEQLSPVSPPTPTPEPISKSTTVLVK